jgi:hypothetical protein
LPAASEAVIVMVFAPETRVMPDTDQDVAPLAVPLVELAALAHLTEDTPTLSLAEPESETVPDEVEYVLELVGDVIATAGTVVSGGV